MLQELHVVQVATVVGAQHDPKRERERERGRKTAPPKSNSEALTDLDSARGDLPEEEEEAEERGRPHKRFSNDGTMWHASKMWSGVLYSRIDSRNARNSSQ